MPSSGQANVAHGLVRGIQVSLSGSTGLGLIAALHAGCQGVGSISFWDLGNPIVLIDWLQQLRLQIYSLVSGAYSDDDRYSQWSRRQQNIFQGHYYWVGHAWCKILQSIIVVAFPCRICMFLTDATTKLSYIIAIAGHNFCVLGPSLPEV